MAQSDFWTSGLNAEQVRAVMHDHGPLLILAGAGSGKTTVLVSRTGRLIHEQIVKSNEICVLTFTNKAARELKARVAAKIGAAARGLWTGTFHSFGLNFLKAHASLAGLPTHFGIIDTSDSQSILRELLKNLSVAGRDKFDLDKLLNLVHEFRVRGRFIHPDLDEYHEVAEVLTPKYQKKMQLLGVVDFEELLLRPMTVLKENPEVRIQMQERLPFLMVDEFQDTNSVQMQLLEMLLSKQNNLAVVGDDDQSIYGWRGAEISNILNFPKRFQNCEVIRLERNYRSASKILNFANHVIGQNEKRHGKVLKPASSRGEGQTPEIFVFSSEDEEAEMVIREIKTMRDSGRNLKEIAVLYRSNSQSGLIEAGLRQETVAFSVSGGTALFDRKEVKDTLAYLRLAIAASDLHFRRVLNVPARGVGETSFEKIIAHMSAQNIGFQVASRAWRELGIPERTGEAIDAFQVFTRELGEKIMQDISLTPGQKLLQVFTEMGYREYVWSLSKDPVAGEKRWMGVEILSRILDRFVEKGGRSLKTLEEFVDAMELRDEPEAEKKNEVSLMTLHASKGLEFPVVFLVGIEEDLLPHRNLGSDISEERRLFYVGITRAQERLILTRSRTRRRYGQARPVSPSRFVLGLPEGLLIEFPEGVRPVHGAARDDLVAGFLAGLQAKSSPKNNRVGR